MNKKYCNYQSPVFEDYPAEMNQVSSETDDCFVVRQAARHISKLYKRRLSMVSVTPTQCSMPSMLNRNPITMVQLADALVIDRTTLVLILKPLLRDGLVVAFVDERLKRRLPDVAMRQGSF